MKHNYSKVLLISAITLASSLTAFAQQTTVVKREWFIQNEKVDTIPITATVLDVAQNIITTGNAIVAGQSTNILTSKIAPDGTILWQQQINGVANGKDFGTANYIDANGNIYIAGAVYDLTNNFDYLIACYDPNGNLQWQQTFDGVAHSYDVPTAITIDNNGNVYVTGSSQGTTSLTDFVTIQLNATNGQINWVKTYNYANLYEIPVSILKNSNGNIYVTGASASSFNNWDIATIEYDPSGNLINQYRNTSFSNGFDKPADMKRDANGNIYIVGRASTANSTFDIKLIKLNSSLAVQWIKTFDGQGLNDEASKVEIDYNGNIIIAGYVQKPIDGKEYIIIKYDSNGNLLWQKEKDFSNDYGDNIVKNIVLDISGNIYATGESIENGEAQIVTVKLDENGNQKWSKEFDEIGKDEVNNIKLDNDGNIYISGCNNNSNVVVQYSQSEALIPPDFNNEQLSINNLFYQNRGQILNTNQQAATNVEFYTNGASPQQFIQNNILSYIFAKGDTTGNDTIQRIDLKFLYSNTNTKAYPNEEQELGYLNYFKPNAPNGITNVKANSKVVVPNIYNNVDLIYSSNNAGTKMYLVAKPTSSFTEVRLQIKGATQTSITNDNLTVSSNWNTFSIGKLTAYQLQGSTIIPITNWTPTYCTFANNTYGFNIGTYDTSLPLVIEISNAVQAISSTPLENIDWSTYYCGSTGQGIDYTSTFYGSTVDAQHNLWAVGYSTQFDFPTSPITLFASNFGSQDAVIAKFDENGIRQFSTYYGGSGIDMARSVVVNAANEAIVVGFTSSTNLSQLPLGNSYQNATAPSAANQDIFIVKLNSTNTSISWSANYGGTTFNEDAKQVALDNQENIYFVGTGDSNTPHYTSGSYNEVTGGLLAKFTQSGIPIWATGFGTDGTTEVWSIAFESNNNFYITGISSASDYPIINSQALSTHTSLGETFVTKFTNENVIDWSTFLTTNTGLAPPQNIIIANDHLYINGRINNNSLFTVDPGSGAYFSTISTAMCTSIYFTKISLQGQVIWSSYYGGTVTDYSAGLCSDNFGNVYFSGYSTSNNFQPIQQVGGYYQKNAIPNSSTVSSFIVAFDSNNQTKWATYFGGTYDDAIYTNTCDKIKNKLYVLGNANSKIDFPLNDGGGIPYFQGTIPSLVSSAFVTRFNISSNFSGIIDLDNSINQVDIFPNPAEN